LGSAAADPIEQETRKPSRGARDLRIKTEVFPNTLPLTSSFHSVAMIALADSETADIDGDRRARKSGEAGASIAASAAAGPPIRYS